MADPSRHQHGEHAVAARNSVLDDLPVIRRSRNDRDTPRELLELVHTDLPAYGDHLVAPVQRELHHVPPQLAGGSDDADRQRGGRTGFAPILRRFHGFSPDGNLCCYHHRRDPPWCNRTSYR